MSALQLVFVLKKKATIPIFHFEKKQKLNEKNLKKEFLLYIENRSGLLIALTIPVMGILNLIWTLFPRA